jgi:hypothetical protein
MVNRGVESAGLNEEVTPYRCKPGSREIRESRSKVHAGARTKVTLH